MVKGMRDKIKNILRENYGGDFESNLEHQYEETVVYHLETGNYSHKHEWATYNQIMIELKHNLKDLIKVSELQYKITEADINPKDACIEVIQDISKATPELERLYLKILSFNNDK